MDSKQVNEVQNGLIKNLTVKTVKFPLLKGSVTTNILTIMATKQGLRILHAISLSPDGLKFNELLNTCDLSNSNSGKSLLSWNLRKLNKADLVFKKHTEIKVKFKKLSYDTWCLTADGSFVLEEAYRIHNFFEGMKDE